jgi:hypothetical protein
MDDLMERMRRHTSLHADHHKFSISPVGYGCIVRFALKGRKEDWHAHRTIAYCRVPDNLACPSIDR